MQPKQDQMRIYGSAGRTAHLFADIRVARPQKLVYLIGKIARHLLRCDIGESAQGQPYSVHVRVVHVADVNQY